MKGSSAVSGAGARRGSQLVPSMYLQVLLVVFYMYVSEHAKRLCSSLELFLFYCYDWFMYSCCIIP